MNAMAKATLTGQLLGRDILRAGLARQVRISAGLSQSDLAAALGVDVSTISRWEAQRIRPSGETGRGYVQALAQLAEAGRL